MDQERLAAHQKKGSELNAFLVFIDESGFLMAPHVRRSWAPRGATPILRQRTRHYAKVSAVAALCVAPDRKEVRLYFRLRPKVNIDAPFLESFLSDLLERLDAPVVLVWDRLNAHRSRRMQRFIESRDLLEAHFLPPYAPELNPVEMVWGYMKTNPLANLAPEHLDTLVRATRSSGRSVQRRPALLRSFVEHSSLPLRLC